MTAAEAWAEAIARATSAPGEVVGAVFTRGADFLHVPCDNVHATPAIAFDVPARQVRALLELEQEPGLRWLALYHSHLGRPAALSAADATLVLLPCDFLVLLRVDGARLTELVWRRNH